MSSDIPAWTVQAAVALFLLLNISTGILAALSAKERCREAEKETFAMLMAMKRLEAEDQRSAIPR